VLSRLSLEAITCILSDADLPLATIKTLDRESALLLKTVAITNKVQTSRDATGEEVRP